MHEFAGKVAVVTGAGSGIGQALAVELGRAGAKVAISDVDTKGLAHTEDQLKAIGVRVEVDARNEKMNAKIREHAMQKVPFLLVVGDKEAEAGKVNVRTRGKEKTEDMAAGEFVEKIRKLIVEKSAGL